MANASHKKRPNKQHDVRGASFKRVAKRIRANMTNFVVSSDQWSVLAMIADALEKEGEITSHLR